LELWIRVDDPAGDGSHKRRPAQARVPGRSRR